MNNKKLIVVTGPTAVGKTEKAIHLAIALKCPIISADSRQVYKELNIGVARPSEDDLARAEHLLIAHTSIHNEYNAGIYAREARNLINKLFETHESLIVCGGTGLYIRALLYGFDPLPGKNDALREELKILFEKDGIEALQQRLLEIDEIKFKSTEIQNPQRLIRAIEIASSLPVLASDIPDFKHTFSTEIRQLECERDILYKRIDERVDQMILSGLEAEAHSLYPFREHNALQTVGYSEWWPYFEGKWDLQTCISKIKQHSRNYAKRQITWFKTQLKAGD